MENVGKGNVISKVIRGHLSR